MNVFLLGRDEKEHFGKRKQQTVKTGITSHVYYNAQTDLCLARELHNSSKMNRSKHSFPKLKLQSFSPWLLICCSHFGESLRMKMLSVLF